MTKPPPNNAEWVFDEDLTDCRILTLGDKTYYGVEEGWREWYGTLVDTAFVDGFGQPETQHLLGPPLPSGGPQWPSPTP